MAVSEAALSRLREKRIYLIAAILFPLIVLIGFGRTYYLKGFFDAPQLPSYLVHIHGLVMTAWAVLFISQVFLIRSKNIRLHQTLGFAGIGLAAVAIIAGFFTAIAAGKNGSATAPADIPLLSFLVVPIFDLVVFAILFSAAVYYRKQAANHRRLMLVTAISLLPPAIARFPGALPLGPLFFFGVPTVIVILALAYDTWHSKKLNKMFLFAALLLIASYPLRLAIGGTDAWMTFATWLCSLSLV